MGAQENCIWTYVLDFELIFTKYLNDFNGKVILEIPEDDNVIIDSKIKIQKAMVHIL